MTPHPQEKEKTKKHKILSTTLLCFAPDNQDSPLIFSGAALSLLETTDEISVTAFSKKECLHGKR